MIPKRRLIPQLLNLSHDGGLLDSVPLARGRDLGERRAASRLPLLRSLLGNVGKSGGGARVACLGLLRLAVLLGVGGSLLTQTGSEILSKLLHGGTLEDLLVELEVSCAETTLSLVGDAVGVTELLDLSHNGRLLDGVPFAGGRKLGEVRRGPRLLLGLLSDIGKSGGGVRVACLALLRLAVLLGVGGGLLTQTRGEILSKLLHGGTLEDLLIKFKVSCAEATLSLIGDARGLSELLDFSHNGRLLDGVPFAGSSEGLGATGRVL